MFHHLIEALRFWPNDPPPTPLSRKVQTLMDEAVRDAKDNERVRQLNAVTERHVDPPATPV